MNEINMRIKQLKTNSTITGTSNSRKELKFLTMMPFTTPVNKLFLLKNSTETDRLPILTQSSYQ